MNFRELSENLSMEEDEYMELIELFIETGISDLKKLQTAAEEANAKKQLISPILLRALLSIWD